MQQKLFNRNYVLLCVVQFCTAVTGHMLLPILPLYLTGEMGISKSLTGVMIALFAGAALAAGKSLKEGRPVKISEFQN